MHAPLKTRANAESAVACNQIRSQTFFPLFDSDKPLIADVLFCDFSGDSTFCSKIHKDLTPIPVELGHPARCSCMRPMLPATWPAATCPSRRWRKNPWRIPRIWEGLGSGSGWERLVYHWIYALFMDTLFHIHIIFMFMYMYLYLYMHMLGHVCMCICIWTLYIDRYKW